MVIRADGSFGKIRIELPDGRVFEGTLGRIDTTINYNGPGIGRCDFNIVAYNVTIMEGDKKVEEPAQEDFKPMGRQIIMEKA